MRKKLDGQIYVMILITKNQKSISFKMSITHRQIKKIIRKKLNGQIYVMNLKTKNQKSISFKMLITHRQIKKMIDIYVNSVFIIEFYLYNLYIII